MPSLEVFQCQPKRAVNKRAQRDQSDTAKQKYRFVSHGSRSESVWQSSEDTASRNQRQLPLKTARADTQSLRPTGRENAVYSYIPSTEILATLEGELDAPGCDSRAQVMSRWKKVSDRRHGLYIVFFERSLAREQRDPGDIQELPRSVWRCLLALKLSCLVSRPSPSEAAFN